VAVLFYNAKIPVKGLRRKRTVSVPPRTAIASWWQYRKTFSHTAPPAANDAWGVDWRTYPYQDCIHAWPDTEEYSSKWRNARVFLW